MLTATLSAAPRALDCNTSYMHILACLRTICTHMQAEREWLLQYGFHSPQRRTLHHYALLLGLLYSLACKIHLFQNLTVGQTHDTQVLAVMYFVFNFIKKIDKPFPLLKVHTVFDFLVIILTSYCMLCRCAVLIHLVIAVSVVKNKHMLVFSIPACTVSISYFRIWRT